MMTDTVIEFVSRQCKTGQHQNCYGKWQGLGFEINCDCTCGHMKNYWALEEDDKNDKQTLRNTKPQQTEIGVGPHDSVCSGCTVDTHHPRGDDLNR
jgi:hypothetical protein